MAKAIKKNEAKKRPNKYDEKLAINGTFADVFKIVKKKKRKIIPNNTTQSLI